MTPEIGKKYGPYEIQGRLGGGGMGHVYLAWDARLHREVAIKLLHNEFAMPGMRERFLREARAASALNHPNICTIFDIGEQGGDPYLVMELLQGETLKDRIQHSPILTDEIICIAREVGEALGAAHAKGVIHRDVKPANIFLVAKPNGTIQSKVLDFGLAKIEGGVLGARTSRSLDLTSPGATVGTLAYMSPEQARGETLDSRSDLFSLGVVLYEMATRHVPFQGATSALIFVQLLNHPPEPIRSWNESIPRDLEKIILKLMAKERTARFQTANELDIALAKLSDKGGGGWLRKAVSSTPPRTPEPARDKKPAPRPEPTALRPTPAPVAAMTAIAEATPRPSNQILRPVSRTPRLDTTPAQLVDSEAIPLAASLPELEALPTITAEEVASADAGQVDEAPEAEPRSEEFQNSLRQEYKSPQRLRSAGGLTPVRMGILAAVLVAVAVGAYTFYHRGRFGPGLLTNNDAIVLTEIENKTGDKSLDGTVAEGLQIALAQSSYLRLVGREEYRAVRHLSTPDPSVPFNPIAARKLAEKFNAKAYLYGSISGTTPPYVLHVDLLDVSSNDVLTSAEERVPSLQQIPDSIDHLADTLRFNAGEERDSISKAKASLVHEATSNLDALHLLSVAGDAYASSGMVEAIRVYQQAVALDPKFALAQLRLTILYRRLRGETGAAEAAKAALAATDNAGERTRAMAQYEYEMDASGDYARAATIVRQVIAQHPHDAEAMEALSRTLRLEGRFTESLQMAQQAYAEDAYEVDAYTQAENSLIGLDRYDAAAQLHALVEKMGLAHLGGALTPAYLEGRQDTLDLSVAALTTNTNSYRPDWSLGLYFDNSGRLAAGAQLWHSRAEAAKKIHGLESAAGFLLSQGALDRAMLGDCRNGLAMAAESDNNPQGITALFNVALAYAICGNSDRAKAIAGQLQQTYPQSFAVRGFYIADITAAIALHDNDPQAALDVLKPARVYDIISLTPYLRGRAHVLLHPDIQVGIVDFQTVLSHRGVPFIVGSVVYPVAEIGVARAFAETGDVNNSAGAYRRFLELWKNADPNQALVTEAREHTK